ncbi:MAG TPA: hypothetical protein VHV54_11955 [Candidatus Binatia bacterium]|nr:hypothetical protein [Candidatus Binatia bacterium]
MLLLLALIFIFGAALIAIDFWSRGDFDYGRNFTLLVSWFGAGIFFLVVGCWGFIVSQDKNIGDSGKKEESNLSYRL